MSKRAAPTAFERAIEPSSGPVPQWQSCGYFPPRAGRYEDTFWIIERRALHREAK
jgi:hypothetical protein